MLEGEDRSAEVGEAEPAVVSNDAQSDRLNQDGADAFRAGDLPLAAELFGKAAALKPNDGNYLCNQAAAFEAMGDFEAAAVLCDQAFQCPDNQVATGFRVANLLVRIKKRDQAVKVFKDILLLDPDHADAHCNLGTALMDLNRLEEAEQHLRAALAQKPDFPECLNNLGILLGRREQKEEAETCFRRAAELRPDFPEVHNNLSDLLRTSGRLDESEACCREALRLRPQFLSAHIKLGNALREQWRLNEAAAAYEEALKLKPDCGEALHNLGIIKFDIGRTSQAIPLFNKAIEYQPEHPESHVHLAIALLLSGRYSDGWKEYEWRWKTEKSLGHAARFKQPKWDGEAIGDKTLLIHAEQGFGDTLQFCRYVPQLALGHRVIFEVQRPLVELMRDLPGGAHIVAQGDPLPAFDLHCPLLSLPRIFGTVIQTIPETRPYLKADPVRTDAWRKRVSALPGLKVGLVWAGNQDKVADRRRSIAFERCAALANLSHVSFISLQKGERAPRAPLDGLTLYDWTKELQDFSDTAALIEALDLVISVDTAVAHLAAALGKPIWLLNRFDRCWRWMLEREDSPWYPSLRQFRQVQPGDWDEVLNRVRAALLEMTA